MKERERKLHTELPGIENLVERIKDGDPQSFQPIYDFYKPRVLNFITGKEYYADDKDLAEDLTQETFFKAYLSMVKGDYVSSPQFGGYLMRIAHRVTIDYARAKNHRIKNELSYTNSLGQKIDLQEALEINEALEAIAKLPEKERNVFMLVKEGMTNQEIADITGLPIGSVKTIIRRVRKNWESYEKVE